MSPEGFVSRPASTLIHRCTWNRPRFTNTDCGRSRKFLKETAGHAVGGDGRRPGDAAGVSRLHVREAMLLHDAQRHDV
jgi:hypothetical protein